MADTGGNHATDVRSEAVTNHERGQQIVMRIEQPKESPWKQPAVYIAILALIVALGGEWRRWTALDDSIASIRRQERSFHNEVNVWEIDGFNREKDVEEILKSHYGIDVQKLFGKRKPPPVPPED